MVHVQFAFTSSSSVSFTSNKTLNFIVYSAWRFRIEFKVRALHSLCERANHLIHCTVVFRLLLRKYKILHSDRIGASIVFWISLQSPKPFRSSDIGCSLHINIMNEVFVLCAARLFFGEKKGNEQRERACYGFGFVITRSREKHIETRVYSTICVYAKHPKVIVIGHKSLAWKQIK